MAVIRNETEKDYEIVEELTRKAFYNIYVPGCVELIWCMLCVRMPILYRNCLLLLKRTDRLSGALCTHGLDWLTKTDVRRKF